MERYLPVNLLVPDPRLIKQKNLPGRGLTKVEKRCFCVSKLTPNFGQFPEKIVYMTSRETMNF